MEIRPHRIIKRKKTRKIKLGNMYVGGDAPISVQSMTNTLTTDHEATIKQIKGENKMNYKKEEIKEYFNDCLKDYDKETLSYLIGQDELHNEIFNTDYYIIGTYKAKKWLSDKAFDVIEFIILFRPLILYSIKLSKPKIIFLDFKYLYERNWFEA